MKTNHSTVIIGVILIILGIALAIALAWINPKKERVEEVQLDNTIKPTALTSPAPSQATETPKVAPSKPQPVKVAPKPVYELGTVGSSITTQNIMTGVNNERIGLGLAPLKENAKLDAAAQAKLDDMLAKNYFAHVSPEGLNSWHWFQKVGYDYKAAGENLARNFGTTQETVTAWMASPTHKANIVKAIYTETGVAVSGSTVVQMFGTPNL